LVLFSEKKTHSVFSPDKKKKKGFACHDLIIFLKIFALVCFSGWHSTVLLPHPDQPVLTGQWQEHLCGKVQKKLYFWGNFFFLMELSISSWNWDQYVVFYRQLPSLGECLSTLVGAMPVAFLEPHLNMHNPLSVFNTKTPRERASEYTIFRIWDYFKSFGIQKETIQWKYGSFAANHNWQIVIFFL